MNANICKKLAEKKLPLATLHYTESIYSICEPGKLLHVSNWKHDFWSKDEIRYFFKTDPTHPYSYIARKPTKVTWPVNKTENATCDVNGSWNAAERVLEMLVKK